MGSCASGANVNTAPSLVIAKSIACATSTILRLVPTGRAVTNGEMVAASSVTTTEFGLIVTTGARFLSAKLLFETVTPAKVLQRAPEVVGTVNVSPRSLFVNVADGLRFSVPEIAPLPVITTSLAAAETPPPVALMESVPLSAELPVTLNVPSVGTDAG